MTPTARRALAVAAIVAVVAAAASSCSGSRPAGTRERGARSACARSASRRRIDPEGALVGDQVSARASVLVDSDAIDPATVRLSARFAPFGLVRTERAVHEDVGHAALVEVTYTLQCVTVDCLYAMEHVVDGRTVARPIRLRRGTLTARTRDGGVERVSFSWPRVNLRSRLDERDDRPARDEACGVPPPGRVVRRLAYVARLGRDRRRGRAAPRRRVARRGRDPWQARRYGSCGSRPI